MLHRAKISSKILLLVSSIVFVVVMIEIILSLLQKDKIVHEAYREELQAIADLQVHNLEREIEVFKQDMEVLQQSSYMKKELRDLVAAFDSGNKDSLKAIQFKLQKDFLDAFEHTFDFKDILALNIDGEVVFHYNSYPYDTLGLKMTLDNRLAGFYQNEASKEGAKYYTYASLPVVENDSVLGILVCKIDLSKFIKKRIYETGLGTTGEILVGVRNDKLVEYIYYTNKLPAKMAKEIHPNDPIFKACAGASGFGIYDDYNNRQNLAVWTPLTELGMGMVIKIETHETDNTLATLYLMLGTKGLLSMGIALFFGLIISRRLTIPIQKLKEALDILSTGELPPTIESKSQDEIGEMINVVNKHVEQLQKTSQFALGIGQGEYKTLEYEPLSANDILGHSLLFMQQSLHNASIKDDERNWVITGVAELGDVMRNNDKLQELCDGIVQYIYKRIDARQAILYLKNDEKEDVLNQVASFAYGKKKFVNRQLNLKEQNLVTHAAQERDVIFRTEIPDSYEYIESGIKDDNKPESILLIPMITNEQLYGVLEFTGDKVFEKNEIQFVQEVSDKIAQTIFNLKINAHTRSLLEEVSHAQTRLQALLVNGSEVIMIYEPDATIRYVSPSVEHILGYTQEELIGTKDLDHIHEFGLKDFERMFNALINNSEEQVIIQYSYYTKSGKRIWLEATGKNMIHDKAINGLIVNIRDITERRRAEQEEKKRGQMQALSENSLDLIIRISDDGQFFYSNPMLQKLTGLEPKDVLNKRLDEVGIDDSVIKEWDDIVRQVMLLQDEYNKEMMFPTTDGDKFMNVNAIPELDDNGNIGSVLVVSHDITERKAIEDEIILKNNKINQSINYAERIQVTILPDELMIRRIFPESFVFFKPRDIVSGDFPYFFQRGDDVYLAAVDCTGHGVPGAMISIVAYFLLNEVIETKGLHSCGEILDDLDHLVTRTFRQDQDDAKIKDGMDLSIIRVNLKTNELEYAGAHRPLYIIRNGELTEIKGNKWPIGGGKAYKNKESFTNTIWNIEKGDSFYFFSDGFPDQFGGPDNRKYGAKRIKRLILEEIWDQPMHKIEQRFDKEMRDWMGKGKQTDDVLLFGLRL